MISAGMFSLLCVKCKKLSTKRKSSAPKDASVFHITGPIYMQFGVTVHTKFLLF